MSKPKRRLDIQRIRQERKLTQKELSAKTGYPQGFVSKMERGACSVPEAFIYKVREALGMDDIDAYVSYEEPAKEAPAVPAPEPPPKNDSDDKTTIRLLLKLNAQREEYVEKLEKEIEALQQELLTLKSSDCKHDCMQR